MLKFERPKSVFSINRLAVLTRMVGLCVTASFLISPLILNSAFAATFSPTTTEELESAFRRAGRNGQHDIIDLGGQVFELNGELQLRADEGFGLELLNGVLERPITADPFRLLTIRGVSYVHERVSLIVIEGVDFRNGLQETDELIAGAGGGGALLTRRDTIIKDSKFENNNAIGYTTGGAIRHNRLLELSNAQFINNAVTTRDKFQTSHGGAIGIDDGGSLFVTQSHFTGNVADEGGAIHADHGAKFLNISQSSFDSNKAKNIGGAIWSSVGEGEVRVSNSSFVNNSAPRGGAAIYTQSLFVDVSLIHLTISANVSDDGTGGAIRAMLPRDTSNLVLLNSIVTDNLGGNCMTTNGDALFFQQSEFNVLDDQSCGGAGVKFVNDSASVFSSRYDYYAASVPSLPIAEVGQAVDLVPRANCLDFDGRHVRRLDNANEPDEYCDAGAFELVDMKYIDVDTDSIRNESDNCETVSNPLQSDIDEDGVGDACDLLDHRDSDNDTVLNFLDNCMSISNILQFDENSNGIGDECDARPVEKILGPLGPLTLK